MIARILLLAFLATYTQALEEQHGATSAVSFTQHHNTVHHVQTAPAYVKAVAAPVHSIGVGPVYSQALGLGGYSSHIAAPAVVRAVGPGHHATSYSSLSFGHAAPVAHQGIALAPVAHQGIALAPVAHHGIAVAPVSAVVSPVAHAVHSVPVANVGVAHAPAHYEEFAHPKYEFAYGVEDHHTGDIHSHKEVRDGDVTQGEYSLHEADGTIRTVKYSVDKHSGFNAVVERSGHATHVQPVQKAIVAPVLAKTLVAAPAYSHYQH